MTVKYPLHKDNNYIRRYDASWRHVPGGSIIGGVLVCSAPVEGDVSRAIGFADSVDLGSSPYDWKARIAAGLSAGSTLSGRSSTIHGGVGSYTYQGSSQFSATYGDCYSGAMFGSIGPAHKGGFISVSTAISSVADEAAKSQLLREYLDARSTFRGGNFIAEVVDTYRMLRHPVDSLWKDTNDFVGRVGRLRKVYRRAPREYSKRLSDAWLGYAYGVKPLFGDIKDANAALQAIGSSQGFDGKLIRGKGTEESVTYRNPGPLGLTGVASWIDTMDNDHMKAQVRYRVLIKARPVSFATVQETFGLEFEDVLPAVWEAVPWSFLVDYFVNVNEILDSWKLADAVIAWGDKGVHNLASRGNQVWVRNNVPKGISVVLRLGPWAFTRRYKIRTPLSQMPYPSFKFSLPSTGQSFNIAALVSSISQSRPR